MRTPRDTRTRRDAGVAIITALVVVAAATVAVSAMLWRQSVAVRKVENQAALGQARWLARSAIEWSRLILLQDAKTSTVDHLGEFWALPLEETRITDDLAAAGVGAGASAGATDAPFADNDAAWISGRIRDAQARINLQGLVAGDQVDAQRLAVLERLAAVLGLDRDLPEHLAAAVAAAPGATSFDEIARAMQAAGTIDAVTAARLRDVLVVLPAPTPVNLNTAPAEVLAAVFPDLPLDAARALVRSREQAWFTQVGDASARLPGTSGSAAPTNASVASGWFEVAGEVRVGRADLVIVALIERLQDGATRVRSLVER